MGEGATRQRLPGEVLHQQEKKEGAHGEEEEGEEEGEEEEGGEDQQDGEGSHGVQGAAQITHMLPNSHEY